MSARIIHFGADACHRAGVLESADYRVEVCHTLADLRCLLGTDPEPDGVILTHDQGQHSAQAVGIVRLHLGIPLILFGDSQRALAESEFDLVIPHLTSPDLWLPEVAAVVAQGQTRRIRLRLISRGHKGPRAVSYDDADEVDAEPSNGTDPRPR